MGACLGWATGLEYGCVLYRSYRPAILFDPRENSMGYMFFCDRSDDAVHHSSRTIRVVKCLCTCPGGPGLNVAYKKTECTRRDNAWVVNASETDDVTVRTLVSREAQYQGSIGNRLRRLNRSHASRGGRRLK